MDCITSEHHIAQDRLLHEGELLISNNVYCFAQFLKEVTMLFYATLVCCISSISAFPSPPGPHVHLAESDLSEATSFRRDQPIVGTYFFYWYNIYTKEHFINGDGSDALVDHPVSNEDFSYSSSDWWAKEMVDVMAAGIDFIAPVYWGCPGYKRNRYG